ncbi:ComEC/Rec2 family competence protein [Olivibacter sp. XZL3]|uniref:ComEC/Rec2 family competence protein n=1 Tax=Olivibacter sp. XZL3 TaxID=1735116 RepID=UPI0014170AE7|nr:ComEC/Rec2 family competence protein [Olivibacter sp. XZL3]
MTGIGLAYLLPVDLLTYRLLRIICLLFAGCFFFIAIKTKWQYRQLYGPAFGLFMATLISLGCASVWKSHPLVNDKHFSRFESSHLLGFVSAEPKAKEHFQTVELTINYAKLGGRYKRVNGKLLLKIRTDTVDFPLAYGDELSFVSDFQPIAGPYNPHEFDYAAYTANHDLWHASFLSKNALKKTGRIRGNSVIRYALATRKKLVEKFNRYFKDQNAASLLAALVLGYRASLDQDVVNAFSATGTIHVLAVSGMHVGIVFAFLAFSLRWLDRPGWLKYIRLLLLLFFVWAYVLITGFAPSVLRAAFMISVFVLGDTLRRNSNRYNSIAISAFFLLLCNPKLLVEVGFQLSYLAVIGIIWLMPLLSNLLRCRYSLARRVWSYVSLCCAAQLANFPLVLYYFHLFPVYFLPANLFVSLPLTLIIYVGFLLLALPVNEITLYIAGIVEQFIVFVSQVLVKIEQWPLATVKAVWLSSYECILLYVFMITLVLAFQFAWRPMLYASIASLLILGLAVNLTWWTKYRSRNLIVFNVRNNMAIGLIDGLKPILYSNADSAGQPFLAYAVLPALEAYSSINHLSFVSKSAKFHYGDIYIKKDQLLFGGKRMLILDGQQSDSIDFVPDWVLVRNNPKVLPRSLLQHLEKKTVLIMDGSNSRKTIEKWRLDAAQLNVAFYCLKDNFAYVWNAK